MENNLSTQTQSVQLWKKNLVKSTTLTLFERKQKMLISEECNKMQVSDAINSGAHFEVLKKWNEEAITLSLVSMLSELLLSVPNTMTPDDIVYMARSIVIDNPTWKPDDILLIFRNAKQGRYEKIYGSFTYQNFNEWADTYAKERDNYIYNKHLETKDSNGCSIENKQQIYKERQGTIGDIKLPPKRIGQVVPDENYFKQVYGTEKK